MSTVDITFSNGISTKCIPQTSITTEFVCLTEKLDASNDAGSSLTMTMTINTISITNALNFAVKSNVQNSVSVIPNSVSPVLKQNITIKFETTFPETITATTDFTVNITQKNNASNFK